MGLLDRFRKKNSPSDASQQGASVANVVASTPLMKPAMKPVVSGVHATVRLSVGDVLIRPVVTEKATTTGTYLFEVQPNANKQEVAKAIQQIYGVTPKSVRVMNVRGKVVRWQQSYGKRKNWKKAIVQLKKGETMNVYQGT